MIYCFDYSTNEATTFNSTKEASEKFGINMIDVQRAISRGWLCSNRFLFDKEEIPQLEIESKQPKLYYLLDIKSGKIYEFNSLKETHLFAEDFYQRVIDYTTISRAIKRKFSCYRLFFVSRENDFSFIKYHRYNNFFKRISNGTLVI